MKERILEFLKAENKSSAQFAEEIGVQPSGISHIVSGRNNPSLDFILKMLDRYKYLSVDWLLFGRGEMYRDKNLQNLFEESLSQPVSEAGRRLFDSETVGSSSNVSKSHDEHHKELIHGQDQIIRHSDIVKIVCFYSNNSFEEYYPRK